MFSQNFTPMKDLCPSKAPVTKPNIHIKHHQTLQITSPVYPFALHTMIHVTFQRPRTWVTCRRNANQHVSWHIGQGMTYQTTTSSHRSPNLAGNQVRLAGWVGLLWVAMGWLGGSEVGVGFSKVGWKWIPTFIPKQLLVKNCVRKLHDLECDHI